VVGATARAGGTVARVLRTLGYAIVAVLVLHIVLTLLQANPANALAVLVARLAATFDLGLSNLFLVDDPMLSVLLNYGVAALVWLLITAVLVRLVSRIG
jgi:small-conductance mechanosensitive channel